MTITTNSDPTTTNTASVPRKNQYDTTTSYPCPHSVAKYNQYMNNQLHGYYHVRLKLRKFYKYIFWFLFDVSTTNAYILYDSYSDICKKKLKEFRTTLAIKLIRDYSSRKRPGRPSISEPPPTRFGLAHYPMRASSSSSHCCHYCHNKKHQHRSTK